MERGEPTVASFEAVILHEQPNKGRTIITKFREVAADVGFAVVLMTPDDVGAATPSDPLKARARQNVVFELGFFIGALGPERVAALVKGDIERPSDFDGVVYISLDRADWKTNLSRELEVAGVTGAKSWAVSEKMVAPTRDDSIQPGCDHPTGAVWSVACGTAAACGEAAG